MLKRFTHDDYKALSVEKQTVKTKEDLESIYSALGAIEHTPFSSVRITIDKRNAHPYAVKHRLQFFAHKANRHLEVEFNRKHQVVLRVHHGR